MPLANFFVEHFNRRFNRQLEGISPRAAEVLLLHDWPGNVRELRNAIERAMILEDSRVVTLGSLPPLGTTSAAVGELSLQNANGSGELTPLEENEKSLVLEAIRKTHGNQVQAAKLLGSTASDLSCLWNHRRDDRRPYDDGREMSCVKGSEIDEQVLRYPTRAAVRAFFVRKSSASANNPIIH